MLLSSLCRYPVYNEFLKEFQIPSGRFYKRRISRLLYQKESWTLWVEFTHHKMFLRMLLSSLYVKIFPFPPWACKRSKWTLAEYAERMFQIFSIKGKLQLCELNGHITKNCLRILLSSFYVKILPFPTQASKRSKWTHADSPKRMFLNCSIKESVQLCELNAHIPKQFLRMLLFSFYVKIFCFPP